MSPTGQLAELAPSGEGFKESQSRVLRDWRKTLKGGQKKIRNHDPEGAQTTKTRDVSGGAFVWEKPCGEKNSE